MIVTAFFWQRLYASQIQILERETAMRCKPLGTCCMLTMSLYQLRRLITVGKKSLKLKVRERKRASEREQARESESARQTASERASERDRVSETERDRASKTKQVSETERNSKRNNEQASEQESE